MNITTEEGINQRMNRSIQAEGMFSALTELRMRDAARGRDSDVYFGRCSALADLGLIDASRVRQLDDAVRQTLSTTGGPHA